LLPPAIEQRCEDLDSQPAIRPSLVVIGREKWRAASNAALSMALASCSSRMETTPSAPLSIPANSSALCAPHTPPASGGFGRLPRDTRRPSRRRSHRRTRPAMLGWEGCFGWVTDSMASPQPRLGRFAGRADLHRKFHLRRRSNASLGARKRDRNRGTAARRRYRRERAESSPPPSTDEDSSSAPGKSFVRYSREGSA
jgi:hypothetical protein